MISKKKKVFILIGMVALLVATGVLNIYLNKNADYVHGGRGVVQYSFFDTYKADRESTREQTMLYLNSIINNQNVSAEERTAATNAQLQIVAQMNTENTLEAQIKALGYEDVVVTVSNSKVTIILKAEELNDVQVAEILCVTLSETNKTASDVRIIPLK